MAQTMNSLRLKRPMQLRQRGDRRSTGNSPELDLVLTHVKASSRCLMRRIIKPSDQDRWYLNEFPDYPFPSHFMAC